MQGATVLAAGAVVTASTIAALATVRSADGPLLRALVSQLGCAAIDLGHAIDDPEVIRGKLRVPGLDVILVTGRMSMGAYDYGPREFYQPATVDGTEIHEAESHAIGPVPRVQQTPAPAAVRAVIAEARNPRRKK